MHRTTYRELAARSRRMANALAALGVKRRRPRRHAGLERLPPHGAVLRGQRLGRGAAHAEPAAARRPGGVDRRPCRRPGAVLRPDLPAADRGDRRTREDHQGLRRDDRPRAHAGRQHGAEPAVLRRARRSGFRRLRLAAVRRADRIVALLHVGHDRQSEGRAVQPPLDDAAHLRRGAARCAELLGARRDPAGGADVPRQRLGPAVRGLHGRREAGLPGPVARRQDRCTSCSRPKASPLSAGVPTVWQGLLAHVEANDLAFSTMRRTDHRRLGLPAGDDARLPGALRRAGAARLGHDRDEPARHRVHA